jgi:NADH:ubiquinone oxidoreductase subunit 6 (subunit J)
MEEIISTGVGDAILYGFTGFIVYLTFFAARYFAAQIEKGAYGQLIIYWGGMLAWATFASYIYQSDKLGVSTNDIYHQPLTNHIVTAFVILFISACSGASAGFRERKELIKRQEAFGTRERRDV